MKWWIVAMTVARLGDAASFCEAHSRGWQEMSPLMPNSCRGQIVMQAAEAGFQGWAATRLARDGHPKLAKWVLGATISLNGFVISHNIRLGR